MNIKAIRYRLNIYIMYGYWFFHNLIFAYVIERLYWASRGMTNQDVVYTEIVYAAVVIILEVPMGSLADRWRKKNMMIISAALSLGEFITLIYAHSFWHFALAVSFAGIGKSLSSGTSNAIVYDSLKLINEEASFEKVMGRVYFFDYFASMIAALLGSYIAFTRGNLTTYWLSLISVSVSVFILLFLREPDIVSEAEKPISYVDCMRDSYNFLKSRDIIRFVLLYGIIIVGIITYVDEFWQVYLNSVKIPVYIFGFVSVARSISSGISGVFAHKIKQRFSYNQIFSVLLVVITISMLVTSTVYNWLGLIPLVILFVAYGLIEPLTMGYLHHRTESKIRATVESFQSFVLRGSTIVIGLIFGHFSTKYSIFIGFRTLGIMLALYCIYYFINNRKRALI